MENIRNIVDNSHAALPLGAPDPLTEEGCPMCSVGSGLGNFPRSQTAGALVTEYEGQVCRAPIERGTYTLPVSVGCPYNRCTYCLLFKHLRYRPLPLEQIECELKRVSGLGGTPKSIFFGDGNAFDLPTQRMEKILDMVHRYLPSCESVSMDATVTSILGRSDAELKRLHELGIKRLYIGVESGLDDVLKFMNKDHSLAQAREAMERIGALGYLYDAHIMTGIAGRGRGIENAEATAKFLIETGASRIINFSMFIHTSARLYQDVLAGRFSPASEQENMLESRRLLELLRDSGRRMLFDGFNDRIELRIRGHLPGDCAKMMTKLNMFIDRYGSAEPIYAMDDDYPVTQRTIA